MKHKFIDIIRNPSNYKTCVLCGKFNLRSRKNCISCGSNRIMVDEVVLEETMFNLRARDRFKEVSINEFGDHETEVDD